MGRRMKRRPVKPMPDRWIAARDRAGLWRIFTNSGAEPLRSPDPLEQLVAVHLAASAPELRWILQELVRRMAVLVPELSWQYKKDGRLVERARGILATTWPPGAEVIRLMGKEAQQEMDLAA